MSQVTHLNNEELLLSCDGELARDRTVHLGGCEECAQRLAAVTADLFEIEEALRSSVPLNGATPHASAWARLEREIRPNVVVFPVRRWAPAIGMAASLLLAAFLGIQYLKPTAGIAPRTETTVANNPSVPETAVPEAAVAEAQAPAVEAASTDPSPKPAALPAVVARVRETPAASGQSPLTAGGTETAVDRYQPAVSSGAQPPSAAELASIAAAAPELRAAAETRNVWNGLPAIAPPSVTERALPAASLSGKQVAGLVDAYRALTKAGLWQEDVRPVWAPSGLWISGTVENAEGRERLIAAVSKAGLNEVSLDVKVRADETRTARLGADGGANGLSPRPLGGVVRTSLMSHFGDAARRSFQSPRPEALQSELDRYVTDVFKSESELLAHAYALHSLVDSVSLNNVDPNAGGEQTVRTFDELVAFHTSAIRDAEARIYDKLSEALPRRFWSYRSTEREAAGSGDRAEQARELLADSLQLDTRLTALLGSQELSIDAREANLSCGELLYKIRARVRQLK